MTANVAAEVPSRGTLRMPESAAMTLGYGVLWGPSREATWSRTPLSMLEGLEATGPVVDLGDDRAWRRRLHVVRHLGLLDRRVVSTWRSQPSVMEGAQRQIAAAAETAEVDAILTIGDLGTFDLPFFLYQDLSHDLVERELAGGNQGAADQFARVSARRREMLRERQHRIFAAATGVLAMSRWYADSLVDDSGLDPHKVHVVHPGASAIGTEPMPVEARRHDAIFVGRDFARKGGHLAIDAVASLRADGLELGLTVIGPDPWPGPGEPPAWVRFLGPRPRAEVAAEVAAHAVFLMPTYFEAFGIVFAEALRAGTPVVGPRAFAVPEIVDDDVDGALFAGWTVDAVKDSLQRALDPRVRTAAFEGAAASESRFSWERSARTARDAVAASI